MRHNISIDDQVLADLQTALTSQRTPTEISAWDLVKAMKPALAKAREQGKTLEEMHADVLSCGIEIKLGTFRKYASDLLTDDEPKSYGSKAALPKQPQPTEPSSLRSMRGGPKPPTGMGC
jgi:hypothetical protein